MFALSSLSRPMNKPDRIQRESQPDTLTEIGPHPYTDPSYLLKYSLPGATSDKKKKKSDDDDATATASATATFAPTSCAYISSLIWPKPMPATSASSIRVPEGPEGDVLSELLLSCYEILTDHSNGIGLDVTTKHRIKKMLMKGNMAIDVGIVHSITTGRKRNSTSDESWTLTSLLRTCPSADLIALVSKIVERFFSTKLLFCGGGPDFVSSFSATLVHYGNVVVPIQVTDPLKYIKKTKKSA